jgi:hypothetical protein
MRAIVLLFGALLAACGGAAQGGTSAQPAVSDQDVLDAIAHLERDPLAADADGTCKLVLQYALTSQRFSVVVQMRYLPFDLEDPRFENGRILLVAYIAGNIRPQIVERVAQDHPVEGIQLLLAAYQKLRGANAFPSVPEYEEWSALDAAGIAALVARVEADEAQREAQGAAQ